MNKGRASAAEERKAIQQVFVWFDHRVAREVGTNKRVANADVRAFDADHNFDCWDTTRNAASLLLVLQEWGLLRHHRVADPRYRGNIFIGQLPHNTAVLRETAAGGTSWVVDMWTTSFGQVPDVMTLDNGSTRLARGASAAQFSEGGDTMKFKTGLLLGAVWGTISIMAQAAGAAEIKVLTTGAFKQVVVALIPEFEKATGHKVVLDNGTVGQLTSASTTARPSTCWCCRRRASRTTSRAARSPPAAMPSSPRSASASWSRRARRSPTSRSVEAFKQALLKAKSVGYIDPASGGSSGIYVAGLLDKLGIADQIKPKAKLQKGGHVSDLVKAGEAEIGIHQISEIVGQTGVTLVGPLPTEIQNYTTYAVGRQHRRQAGRGRQGLHQGADRPLGRGGAQRTGMEGRLSQTKAPARCGRFRSLAALAVVRLALGVFPGHARDVAAGDADVGQFAIAEPIELAKALVVAAPLPVDANQMSEEHGR